MKKINDNKQIDYSLIKLSLLNLHRAGLILSPRSSQKPVKNRNGLR